MTNEETIFAEALGKGSASERDTYLAQACAGNAELRREVESLITADDQGLSFIDEPAVEVAASLFVGGEPGLAEGQSIGHYEIVGLIVCRKRANGPSPGNRPYIVGVADRPSVGRLD